MKPVELFKEVEKLTGELPYRMYLEEPSNVNWLGDGEDQFLLDRDNHVEMPHKMSMDVIHIHLQNFLHADGIYLRPTTDGTFKVYSGDFYLGFAGKDPILLMIYVLKVKKDLVGDFHYYASESDALDTSIKGMD